VIFFPSGLGPSIVSSFNRWAPDLQRSLFLMMKILETERLALGQLTTEDDAFILELMNEPDFIRFVADRGLRTRADAAAFLSERILPSYQRHGFGFYRVDLKDSETAIGICGLVKRETLDWVDIGFSILERFRGNGYAFEAAQAVMNYGRTVLELPRIVGVTAPDNRVSIRLLEKLGLRFQEKIVLPGYGPESLLFG
jgi:RimJ/RimL family protein N-acetyltransferase